jgi:branched-chain amino acid transport system substrate-binding protein
MTIKIAIDRPRGDPLQGGSTMKKPLLGLLSLLTAAGLVAACNDSDHHGSDDGEVITLGVIAPLTGALPEVGASTKNAAEMAVDEINEAGGLDVAGTSYRVAITLADNEADADASVAAATALITEDHVLAIIGPQSSKQAVPTGQVANDLATPMISPWSTEPGTTLDRPWVFRAAFLNPFQGRVLSNFARTELGAATAAVLYDAASDYPRGMAEDFSDAFEAQGGTITAYQSFTTGDTDFRTQLAAIAETHPDILFTPQHYNEVPLIVEQARDAGITGPILGSDTWGTTDLLDLCGAACDGLFFSTHYAPDIATEVAQAFIHAYQERYGETPDDVAALTYDAFEILFQAIRDAGVLDKPALRDSLAAVDRFEGVTGIMSFDDQGDPTKCAVILQIQDGAFTYYDQACPPGFP